MPLPPSAWSGGGSSGIPGNRQSPWGNLDNVASPFAAGSMPWNIILPIALSFLGDLFGGNEEDEMMERGMKMQQLMRQLGFKAPYQSPYTKGTDTAVFQALINQMKRMGNFGYPQGMQMDMSFLDKIMMPGQTGRRIQLG